MATGTCKWFNRSKGFGFIVVTDGGADAKAGEDVFVHFSKIKSGGTYKALDDGQEVEFNIVIGPKGKSAEQVRVVRKKETASS